MQVLFFIKFHNSTHMSTRLFFILLISFMQGCCAYKVGRNDSLQSMVEYTRDIDVQSEEYSSYVGSLIDIEEDDDATLNEYESNYLEKVFSLIDHNISLKGKRIWFDCGKTVFFKQELSYYKSHGILPPGAILYLFDEDAKKKANGYDGAILSWQKRILTSDCIIKKICDNFKAYNHPLIE